MYKTLEKILIKNLTITMTIPSTLSHNNPHVIPDITITNKKQ